MTEQERPGRDPKFIQNIALAGVATVLAGVAIGWAILGADQSPTGTTVAAGEPTTTPTGPATTTTTMASPPSTDAPGQITFTATEDTYVKMAEPAEINGLDELIEVEDDPPDLTRGLVRFEVTGIPEGETIRSATLRLYSIDESEDTVVIHGVDGPWNQAETNGGNAPSVGAQVASIPVPIPENQYLDIDVTSVVTAPGQYDFYLVPSGGDTAEFASIESAANPPTLVVRWLDDVTAGSPALTGDPVRLVGAGGIADCGEGASVTADLLDESVDAEPTAVVFTTGDNVTGEGTAETFTGCYDSTWGRHLERTRPAVGEGEYETTGATGYFDYYGEAAGPAGAGYYGYEAGEWDVFVLNSNCGEVGGCDAASSQGQWLAGELADSDASCTVAYWHHGLHSSGADGGDESVLPLVEMLYENGAELILTGHDQIYERFAQQDPSGLHDPVAGIRQFMIGAGGSGPGGIDDLAANSESRYNGSSGVLQLDLYANGYEWEFTPEPGSDFLDTGIGFCH